MHYFQKKTLLERSFFSKELSDLVCYIIINQIDNTQENYETIKY